VPPGDTFAVPSESAYLYVLLGTARLVEAPCWWPDGTPADPASIDGAIHDGASRRRSQDR
jgi:hypothetical protein